MAGERFRFTVPEEEPSDKEMIFAALALLMSDAAATSKVADFRSAAMVMAIRLHERTEVLAEQRAKGDRCMCGERHPEPQ